MPDVLDQLLGAGDTADSGPPAGPVAYNWGQGESSVYDRIRNDDLLRRNSRPRTPPNPTLTGSTFQLADGTTAAAVSVSWSPVRKSMDYITRWKKGGDVGYTYERIKTSPHIIRPVDTSTTISVGLAVERRETGARSAFAGDINITTAGDTTPPNVPILTIAVNDISGVIQLTWTASTASDLAYYVLSRATTAGSTGEYQRPQATNFDDWSVTAGTTYFYRVRAADRSGNVSGYSNEVNGTVAFVGTLPLAPQMTCVCDPTNTFSTIASVPVTLPAGSRFLTAQVSLSSNTLIAAPNTVSVRFSIGTNGSDPSSIVQLVMTTAGQTKSAILKSVSALSVSGSQTLLFEWRDDSGNTSTYQLTTPGSLQVTVS